MALDEPASAKQRLANKVQTAERWSTPGLNPFMLCNSLRQLPHLARTPARLRDPGLHATSSLDGSAGFAATFVLCDNDLASDLVGASLQHDEVNSALNVIRIPGRHANDPVSDWRANDFVHELAGHVVDGKRNFTGMLRGEAENRLPRHRIRRRRIEHQVQGTR